ncbi:hypothetical protein JCGZ_04146 [Jatropha curcas]|uniref:Uncharacterized protein n=1 Tax=Jatropha curcas TaxID=180498 RepID=A0A067KTJ7_JATCU|nr:hypothetical protein JCGZ_04146 [Jatropha curcas]
MPPRYKRSRPTSSIAVGHRSSRSSTASPPSDSPPLPPFETSSPEQLDSLDSRLDTLQGHYQGLSTQLQTVIQLLQPPPPAA